MSREYVIREESSDMKWATLTVDDTYIEVPYRGTEEEIQARIENALKLGYMMNPQL